MLAWLRKVLDWFKSLFKKQEEPKPKFSVVIEGVEYVSDDVEELNEILREFSNYIRPTQDSDQNINK